VLTSKVMVVSCYGVALLGQEMVGKSKNLERECWEGGPVELQILV
jgi:hypothetical protein